MEAPILRWPNEAFYAPWRRFLGRCCWIQLENGVKSGRFGGFWWLATSISLEVSDGMGRFRWFGPKDDRIITAESVLRRPDCVDDLAVRKLRPQKQPLRWQSMAF